jgi:outer membrane protein OmpA-like peptidoglycan-associated protein
MVQRGPTTRTWFITCLASGALTAILSAGCGLSALPPPAPVVPSQPLDLGPPPPSAVDRMARVAPDLYFQPGSHILQPRERRKFDRIAPALEDLLHDFPGLVIMIEGHSDDRSLIEYNDRLAAERAGEIRRLLLELSFPEDRLRTARFVYREPQCQSRDDLCRQNRSVHFRPAQAPRVSP